jgi:hypothetical protein
MWSPLIERSLALHHQQGPSQALSGASDGAAREARATVLAFRDQPWRYLAVEEENSPSYFEFID